MGEKELCRWHGLETLEDRLLLAAMPTVTVSATVDADEGAMTPGYFTISRSFAEPVPKYVNFYVSGTAHEGSQYKAIKRSVMIPSNETSTTVYIYPLNDHAALGDTTVNISIIKGDNYVIGSPYGTVVNIVDGDPLLGIVLTQPDMDNFDYTLTEASGDYHTRTIRVISINEAKFTQPTTVTLTFSGTAKLGQQYIIDKTVTFATDDTYKDIPIEAIYDGQALGDQTIAIGIKSNTKYYSVDSELASEQLTLVDSAPKVSIELPTENNNLRGYVTEEAGQYHTLDLTVKLSSAFGTSTDIPLVLSGAAVWGKQYTISKTVSFGPSETSKTVTLTALSDPAMTGFRLATIALKAGASYMLVSGQSSVQVGVYDSAPMIDVEATDNTASETDLSTGMFTLYRSASDLSQPLTVTLSMSGTAQAGKQYAALPQTVTFPKDASSVTVAVTPLVDSQATGDRTMIATVKGDNKSYYGNPSYSSATVTIADAEPVVSITATTANAYESTLANGVFTITRTTTRVADDAKPLTVNLAFSGTAGSKYTISGATYNASKKQVTIPANESSATVNVVPKQDKKLTGPLTIIATVKANPNAYTVNSAKASATVYYRDDESHVSITATSGKDFAGEIGLVPGEFTITRDGDTNNPLTVKLSYSGSAAAGKQYVALPKTVTIPAGAASTTLTVTPLDDGKNTGNRSIIATIQSSADYVKSTTQPLALVTFWDSSVPLISIEASEPVARELGAVNGEFTISRIGGNTAKALQVSLAVSPFSSAQKGVQYVLTDSQGNAFTGKSVTIPAGQLSTTLKVVPVDDNAATGNKTVIVGISVSSAYNTNKTASTATVDVWDKQIPVVSIQAVGPVAVEDPENWDFGTYRISRLGGDSTQPLTVKFSISGTATSAQYELRSGVDDSIISGNTVTIPAGEMYVEIFVSPLDDHFRTGDTTVIMTLSPSSFTSVNDTYNIEPAESLGTVTIQDNTNSSVVSIQATTPSAYEDGAVNGIFTVSRTGDTSSTLNVKLAFTGTAVLSTHYQIDGGANYNAVTHTLTISAGQSSATLNVVPLEDFTAGGDMTIIATLQVNGSAYDMDSDMMSAKVDLIDKTSVSAVSVEATTPIVIEDGQQAGVFTITRIGGDTTQPLTVDLSPTMEDVPGAHFEPLPTSVTIAANQTTAFVNVVPVDDHSASGNVPVVLGILSSEYYDLTPDEATATVVVQQKTYLKIVSTTAIAKEDGPVEGVFTITRVSPNVTSALVVPLTISGSATLETQYILKDAQGNTITVSSGSASITLSAGTSSTTLRVVPVVNSQRTGNGSVIAQINTSDVYDIRSGYGQAVVTVWDKELPVVSVQATTATTQESDPATPGVIQISRTGSTASSLDVNLTITGTAESGVQYTALPTTITIPTGASSYTLYVTPIDDQQNTGNTSAIVSLATGVYTQNPDSRQATVTIVDAPAS
jgi:hypothetical protein